MNTRFGASGNGYEDESDDELNEHLLDPGDPDGLVADELQRKQMQNSVVQHSQEDDVIKQGQYPQSKGRWKVIFATVLIVAAVGAAYLVGSRHTTTPTKKQTASTTKRVQPAKAAAAPTTHYDSTTYGVGIDYPNNWTVSDTTDALTIISPNLSMATLTGQTNGHVIVTIHNQQTTVPGFPADGATASLESDKLTYVQPTPVQRAQTFLSYLGYTSANSLDALYLTGDAGYQQAQTIPLSDVIKGNPLVSVSFATCSGSFCANETPKSIALKAASWKDASFKTAVINILQSLAIN